MSKFQIIFAFLLIFGQFFGVITPKRSKRSLYSAKFPVTVQEARSVVALTAYFRKILQHCSGVLLSDRIVLTAAHCLYREKSGFADYAQVKSEGWSLYAGDFIIPTNFVLLDQDESICADVGIIILPKPIPGFFRPEKFAKFSPEKLPMETFALGYGMTEWNVVSSDWPRKVPLAKPMSTTESCFLALPFADSALSCSGDSGGAVFYYPMNATDHSPIFLGIASQIVVLSTSDSTMPRTDDDHPQNQTKEEHRLQIGLISREQKKIIEGCKRAKQLLAVHTLHIQMWLKALIRTEPNPTTRLLFIKALKALIGD